MTTDLEPVNIAEILTEEKLQEIGQDCVYNFKADIASRAEWTKRATNWLKLFSGHRDPKSFPWPNCCFHEDVEILTEEGWKLVKDIVVGDLVFSREPLTGNIELKNVSDIHDYDAPHDGLVRLSNLFFDIQVTGNHRFLLEDPIYKNTKIITADEIFEGFNGQTNYKLPLSGKWEAEEADTFFGYNADDFLELLGWYISEGWSYKNRCIGISQSSSANPEKVAKIISLLERLGFSYKYNGISFLINVDSIIAEHFRSFGNCHEKRIPRMYLDLPPVQLQKIFDTLVQGDGHICWAKDKHRNFPRITYYTTSPYLADDFQELCLKLGFSASISKRMPKENGGIIRGKKMSGKLVGYNVSVRFTQYSRFRQDRAVIEKVPYMGRVYCVTVPDWNTIYVRQNGKPLWTMNSNVHIPLMGVACLQFQARAYESLVPQKEVAKCWATDGKAIDSAARATRYMNYQLFDEMEEWEEDMDLLQLLLPIYGSAVKKTYYDNQKKRAVSLTLGHDSFVAPYGVKRLEDATRKTHFFYLYPDEIKRKVKSGQYIKEADTLETGRPITAQSLEPELKEQSNKITGQTEAAGLKIYPRLFIEQHTKLELDENGIQSPYIITIDVDTEMVVSIKKCTYISILGNEEKEFEYFTSYSFIPNPESWMSYGFGHFLEGLNESGNTIINQLIDAGTLSNVSGKTGLINKRAGLKKNKIDMALGQFNEIDMSGDDIKKSMYIYDFKEPSQVLFSLLGFIREFSREISTVSEALMGKLPPSDTTATTMLAVMEQGMKVFSTIHKREHRSLKKELKKIFIINSLYLDEQKYYTVQDSTSPEMQTYKIGRLDFLNLIDVRPASDPNITSRAEKLVKARSTYEIAMQNPLMVNDMEAIYEITKDLLIANEVSNIDQKLKKPQPQEPPDLTPQEEHAEFLKEKMVEPLPLQDHFAHLQEHTIFSQSEWFTQLTPQGKKVFEEHTRKTMAWAYLVEQEQIKKQTEAIDEGFGNTGGMVGMGGISTDTGVFEPSQGNFGGGNEGMPEGNDMGAVSGTEGYGNTNQ